jgi:hypothetical protein
VTDGDAVTEDAPTAAGGRIEVVGGGTPSAAELAALTVALTPTGGGDDPAGPATPAWARAGLLENVGHRRPQRPSDLDAAFRLG